MDTVLPTTLVGSYPQPDWLIDRAKLAGRFPPRVRARELWRVAPESLEQAQDDATLLAIRDQDRAGLDIIIDGEMRRESYSNRFATAPRRHRHRQSRQLYTKKADRRRLAARASPSEDLVGNSELAYLQLEKERG
jgi:Cobalamin-independent synthase, Catalytic domain